MDAAQYADLFLTESREHLSAINLALLDLERALESTVSPGVPTEGLASAGAAAADGAIASLFRAVHTIKGMSATLRYSAVAALSHEMEALLDRFRRHELAPDAATMDLLFAAADILESSIERAVAGHLPDPRVDRLIERVRATASMHAGDGDRVRGRTPSSRPRAKSRKPAGARPRRKRSASAAAGNRAARRATAPDPNGSSSLPDPIVVRITFAADAPLRGARAAVAVKRAAALGEVVGVTPAPDTFADDGPGPDAVEIRLRTTAAPADVAHHLEVPGDVATVEVLAATTSQVPDPAIAAAAPPRRSGPTPSRRSDGSTPAVTDGISRARHVRIDLRRLDALMNLIGELVIARGRLVELTTAEGESALSEAVADAGRLIGDLQDEIMTCRMVPVWQVFDRFPRLVRDAAHALGKQVAFEVEGKEIELDRSMLDEIGDPIVHLLRNAIDHGIESPEARVATGKLAQGHLTLSAARDRSAVLIRVTDDGRGIDRSKVLARAVQAGLVDPTTTALTDDEVIRLIARPGFTTVDQVTSLSGRGVGIDAVQTRVRALGGSVEITSAPGQGTTVTARLPLTLAIMRALLARAGGESYAFPMAHVAETVGTAGAVYAAVRGQPVLLLRGEAIPFVTLRAVVGLGPAAGTDPEQHIIVVESGGRRTALAVDELSGQADIVVKQYDAVRGGAGLFSGATILGDGAPALIVDVSSLL